MAPNSQFFIAVGNSWFMYNLLFNNRIGRIRIIFINLN
jgi:hypothetical protein